ncbi:MAG TPA: sigma 54-interacting transcriptional regulator [Vicinamibacterales bacterium]
MATLLETPPSDILKHISDALVLLDLDGRIVFHNEAFAAMVAHPGEDLRGASWAQLADSATCARTDLPALPTPDQGQVHFNIELTGGDGAARSYCLTATPFKDRAGRTVGVFQNFRSMDKLRDMILGLREVNEAIQREKDRTERIVASIADGVFTVDRALVVRSFSAGMERLTGMASSDAVGRACAEVFCGTKCTSDCPLHWTLERRASVERCRETFRAGGRALPVSITTALLTDAGEDETLVAVVHDLSEIERLRRELAAQYTRHDLIGRSRAVRELGSMIDSVADTDATVLITGETGTGKELVARAIHGQSRRRDRPFVSINCAALNDNLLESELFGHVRGAFTGAVHDKAGRFEAAAGGTILLDEIGDTTAAFQAKLLRVLQEKAFERVGDTRTRRVDVRVIAATNRDLRQLVQEGAFREDLYYRLAVVPIHVAPLRERLEDIPLLVEHFIQTYRPKYFAGREEHFQGISNRALALLLEYRWPGNVRELEHAIEYAMVSTTANRIERAFLPASIRQLLKPDVPAPGSADIPASAQDAEEAELRRALEANRWNASRTALALGISRTTLWRRMRRHALLPRV